MAVWIRDMIGRYGCWEMRILDGLYFSGEERRYMWKAHPICCYIQDNEECLPKVAGSTFPQLKSMRGNTG